MSPSVVPPSSQKSRSLLDVNDVAELLSVTPRFVRRLVSERRIPFVKVGKFVRFDPVELEMWLDGRRVAVERQRIAGRLGCR